MTSSNFHDKRKDNVLSLIFENAFVGFNELWELSKKDPTTDMAKITLKKMVDELIDEGNIKKIREEGKQKIKLCAFTEELDESATNYCKIEEKLNEFEIYFEKLKKLTKERSISDIHLSRLVYRFVKSIWFLDWKCKSNFMPIKSEEKRILKRLDNLKTKLFELSYYYDEIMTTVVTLVSNQLTTDMLNDDVYFTDELEEYDYE